MILINALPQTQKIKWIFQKHRIRPYITIIQNTLLHQIQLVQEKPVISEGLIRKFHIIHGTLPASQCSSVFLHWKVMCLISTIPASFVIVMVTTRHRRRRYFVNEDLVYWSLRTFFLNNKQGWDCFSLRRPNELGDISSSLSSGDGQRNFVQVVWDNIVFEQEV